MKKTILYLACIFGLYMIAVSCEDDIDENKSGKLTRMNIEEAKLLYITTQNGNARLYGVKDGSLLRADSDENGQVYEIEYFDSKGNTIDDKSPYYVYDAGAYLITVFKKSHELMADEVYLVRKTDGRAFALPEQYFPVPNGNNELFYNASINRRLFRVSPVMNDWDFFAASHDTNNNLFYTSIDCSNAGACPEILYRVSTKSSGDIDVTPLSAAEETVWGFCVDKQGNALYGRAGGEWMRYADANGNVGEPIPTVVKTNGDVPVSSCDFVWSGTQGIMALYTYMSEYDGEWVTSLPENKHFLMKLVNGRFEPVKELSLKFTNNKPSSRNVFYVGGKVIYNHSHGGVTTLVDVSHETSYREIPCAKDANIQIADKLYNFDRNTFSLTHIDIQTGATTPIYGLDRSVLNGYTVSFIMDVTESGVLFQAHRTANRTNVVAKIDINNELTILQSNSGEVSVFTNVK